MQGNEFGSSSFSSGRKVTQGNEFVASVEEPLLRGKEDRHLKSVQTLSDRKISMITCNGKLKLPFEEMVQLSKALSEVEGDVENRK